MAIKIKSSKLLLVEGNHEVDFFTKLLESMTITDVQVEPVGGDRLFKPHLLNLPGYPNYSIVKSIGIIRDADTSFENTFQSVQDALRAASLPTPDNPMIPTDTEKRVAVFIMPDNSSQGALEDLLMDSVKDDPALGCVHQYFECLRAIQDSEHPHLSKAQTQVYLAKEPDGDIHMGTASRQDVWNWNSPAFDRIRTFIQSL